MTVKELKEKLNQFDDNLVVMMPTDANIVGYTYMLNISQGLNELDGCLFIDAYTEDD